MSHFVYKYVHQETGKVVYVGKTDRNVWDRIHEHTKESRFIPYLPYCHIFYLEVANSVMSDVVESELIRRYKPILNSVKTSSWDGLPFPEAALKWTEYPNYLRVKGKGGPTFRAEDLIRARFCAREESKNNQKKKMNQEEREKLRKQADDLEAEMNQIVKIVSERTIEEESDNRWGGNDGKMYGYIVCGLSMQDAFALRQAANDVLRINLDYKHGRDNCRILRAIVRVHNTMDREHMDVMLVLNEECIADWEYYYQLALFQTENKIEKWREAAKEPKDVAC